MPRWKAAFQVLVGLGLVALLLTRIDKAALLAALANCDIRYLLLGLLFIPLLVWLQSVRLHLLIGKVTGRRAETFRLVLLSFFFNQFLPSAIGGDGYKVVYLKSRSQSWKRALALVTLDRMAGLLVVVAGGLLYLVFPGQTDLPGVSQLAALEPSLWWWLAVPLTLLLGMLVKGPFQRLAERLKKEGWEMTTLARRGIPLLALAVLALAARVYRIHFFLLGFQLDLHSWNLVYVMFLTNIAMLIPLTIGGLGIQEGVMAYTLSWFGVPLPVGAGVALLNRMAVWLVGLVGGLLFAGTPLGKATSVLFHHNDSGHPEA